MCPAAQGSAPRELRGQLVNYPRPLLFTLPTLLFRCNDNSSSCNVMTASCFDPTAVYLHEARVAENR